jgi:nicotinamide-nucleotide amidase
MATAEACTGGGIAAALTDIPGSSAWFAGAVVTYANEWKTQLLGVPTETLARHGAVSEETVHAMLSGLVANYGVTVGIAVSGIAGPGGGTAEKPVGTVVVGAIGPGWRDVRTMHFNGLRDTVRMRSATAGMNLLIEHLLENNTVG